MRSSEMKGFMCGCTLIQTHPFIFIIVFEGLMCFVTTVRVYYTNYSRRYRRISRWLKFYIIRALHNVTNRKASVC